ncbi:MAG: YbgC/FadM family acyl-CoA thioesterase [Betaproteobacteria bacterium AqS2]|uniref:YbgC/FadM family acyl-CoA thioesterase n=1 Tax=Candidatus Amphirhobacter heronislandensis TaxID=1732024 RepID=A0A930Y1J9_9GAMM|nr:YbgC/FadM family acyl-CoA thioesterase [Betaproteobacteria bacterium AqS2]
MSAEEPTTEHRLRVYVADTDLGGVAHHSCWLRWYEQGRSEWLRERGLAPAACIAEGAAFVVVSAELSWRRPLRLDDEVLVATRLAEAGPASAVFDQQMRRGGESCGTAVIKVACVDAATLRPRRLPAALQRP